VRLLLELRDVRAQLLRLRQAPALAMLPLHLPRAREDEGRNSAQMGSRGAAGLGRQSKLLWPAVNPASAGENLAIKTLWMHLEPNKGHVAS
jgi:hypothetical protein